MRASAETPAKHGDVGRSFLAAGPEGDKSRSASSLPLVVRIAEARVRAPRGANGCNYAARPLLFARVGLADDLRIPRASVGRSGAHVTLQRALIVRRGRARMRCRHRFE